MRCIIIAILALCTTALAQNEVPYQSESGSWSFTKPSGWNPIGFAVMREVEADNRSEFPDKNFKYIAGFTRGGMNTFNYPYMFVNVTDADLSGLSYGDLEKGLAISKPKGKRETLLYNAVRQFAWGETVVDGDRNRTVSTVHIKGRGKGPVKVTVYSLLGAHNVVQFVCFDLEANGSKNDAYVGEIVNTFKFADGHSFVPTAGISSNSRDEGLSRAGAIVLLSIVGGAVVLGVAIKLIIGAMSKSA
jgi:hypothetical protein